MAETRLVRVPVPTGPSVTLLPAVRTPLPILVEPGPVGPGGPMGGPGPQGVNTGFGQITYTDRTIGIEDVFAPGVRAQILFTPTPSLTQDFLNPPFEGFTFWQDNRLVARAMGDLIDVQVNLIVTADLAGGGLRVDADVGSAFGPIASDTQVLFNGAGVPERVTFRLRLQVLAGFLANGCAIYLTSNVPILVVSETIFVAPASIYVGSLSADVSLTGALVARASLTGAIEIVDAVSLTGDLSASCDLVGILTQSIVLSGGIAASGILTGALTQSVALAGNLTARGTLAGTLRQDIALIGAMVGKALLSGTLRQDVALSGAMVGRGVLAGTMTVTSSEDTDAASYLNAQTTAPSSTERSLVDALVKGIKADGDWTGLDWLNLLAAETAQAARLNARNPAKALGAINLPTFTANRGYAGDGSTAYLDFQEAWTAAGNQFALNSAALGTWCNLQGASVGPRPHISNVANNARASITARDTAGNETVQANDTAGDTLQASPGTRTGHRIVTRTGATTKSGFFNGTKVLTSSLASSTVNVANVCLLRSGASYSDDRLACSFWGAGISDAAALRIHARLNTYLTAKGAT